MAARIATMATVIIISIRVNPDGVLVLFIGTSLAILLAFIQVTSWSRVLMTSLNDGSGVRPGRTTRLEESFIIGLVPGPSVDLHQLADRAVPCSGQDSVRSDSSVCRFSAKPLCHRQLHHLENHHAHGDDQIAAQHPHPDPIAL